MLFKASCTILSKSRLEALRENLTSPRPNWFAANAVLQAEMEFPGDGYYCGLALLWLQDKQQVNLMHSDYDDLARKFGTGRTCVILTNSLRERYYDRIVPEQSSREELAAYAGDDAGADGLRQAAQWLKDCLGKAVGDQAAVVLIG
ncbi:MAG: hypothetical protein ACM3XS_08860 [Bacteroidota bacterium]